MNPGHQQLFRLLVDSVLRITSQIGVRVRATPSNPRPLGGMGGEEEPSV
jgi:hypothetical protein